VLELRASVATVVVSPSDGGRIASAQVHGHDLLVTGTSADHPMQWGCFPMAPWAGRVRRGRFRFAGTEHELPRNLGPHAIHGTTFDVPWEVEPDGSLAVELGPRWPFGGHARQRFELADDRLVCTLEVHADQQSMPATIGWHPWFRRPVTLRFAARSMYERDGDGIPTGQLVTPPPGPWDDCFTGVDDPPGLAFDGGPTIEIRSDCDHWVVYTEPTHALCVEPQSGPPDAFTLVPHAVLVEPGAPLVRHMTWRWA
jgi:aldose 1-epimerase